MSDFTNRLAMPDEREWLATQYVLGELSAAESESFELAMLNDSDLCQLVAESSLLISGIHAASHHVGGLPHVIAIQAEFDRPKPRAMWLVRTALAAAIVFAGAIALRSSTDSAEGRLSSVELEALTSSELPMVAEVAEPELDVVSDESDPNCRLCSLDAPEWLMTAVELEQESVSEDEDNESEVF